MNTVIKCEVCQYETTVEELFEDNEITMVCEHWYCNKTCYDKEWEKEEQGDDEW